MTYLEKNLRKGEKVVAQAKISLIPLVPNFILALIVLIVGAKIGGGSGVVVVLAAILYAVIWILKLKSQVLAVTNQKIIGKTGVIMNKSIDAYLEKIDNISVSESFAGKLFGYATIQISTTSCRLRFPGVCAAFDFKNVVMDQIENRSHDKMAAQANYMNGTATPASAPAPSAPGTCPVCGYVNNQGSKFCESCGNPLT